jgi:hypothetical protein
MLALKYTLQHILEAKTFSNKPKFVTKRRQKNNWRLWVRSSPKKRIEWAWCG